MAAPTDYTYDPLPSSTSIRLLEPTPSPEHNQISFRLVPYELSELPAFNALSYTWGNPRITCGFSEPASGSNKRINRHTTATHQVLCDGVTFLVRANLASALDMLWNSDMPRAEGGLLWIDAICIDQSNLDERASQVQHMTTIFASAESVIAWLGEEDDFTEGAAKVIETLAPLGCVPKSAQEWDAQVSRWQDVTPADLFEPSVYKWKLGTEMITIEEWTAWIGFTQRPYFRRAWIVQEIVLAKRLDIICGRVMVPWEEFEKVVYFLLAVKAWDERRLKSAVMQKLTDTSDDSDDDDGIMGPLDVLMISIFKFGVRRHVSLVLSRNPAGTEIFGEGGENGDKVELNALVERHRDTEATDPRDKIYALLPMAVRGLDGFPVDYKSSNEVVYSRMARHLARLYGDLSIFSHRESSGSRKIKSLPSWVPDFSVKHERGGMDSGTDGGGSWVASGRERWQPDGRPLEDFVLGVQGRLLGRVEEICNPSTDDAKVWCDLADLVIGMSTSTSETESKSSPSIACSGLELLARTITRNTFRTHSHAPDNDMSSEFMNYLVDKYLSAYGPLEVSVGQRLIWRLRFARVKNGHCQSILKHRGSSIESAVGLEPHDGPYGWDVFIEKLAEAIKIRTRVVHVYYGDREKPVTDAKLMEEQLPHVGSKEYTKQFDMSLKDRVVFRTSDGMLLGLGPSDIRRDDEVWVLNGAKTPVILRRVIQGRYGFLGESYVYGMMHGEALERFPKVDDIVLV